MQNYIKAITGQMATAGDVKSKPLRCVTVGFEDTDPEDARRALGEARDAFPLDVAALSVWKRAATVPSYVLEIGEVYQPKRSAGSTSAQP